MKRCKNWVVTIVAFLMLVGEISVLPANLQGSTSVVNAAIHHRRRSINIVIKLRFIPVITELLIINDQKSFT